MNALDSQLCPVLELVQCAQLSSWEWLWTLHNSSNSWWCNAVDNKTKNLKQSITAVLILNRIFPPHVSRARNWPPPIIKTFHKQYWELDEWNDQRRNIRQTISTRPSSLIFENWLCVNIRFSLSLRLISTRRVCIEIEVDLKLGGKRAKGRKFYEEKFLRIFFSIINQTRESWVFRLFIFTLRLCALADFPIWDITCSKLMDYIN